MAPTPLGSSTRFFDEMNSAEPVQIISKPGLEYESAKRMTPKQINPGVPQYRTQIVWRNILIFIYLHTSAVYGLYHLLFLSMWKTVLFSIVMTFVNTQGITSGAHRLWAHRAYKAKLPLRIFLCICQTIALQNHIYEWVRDHRVHHKFTETDADPHNAARGFFFSHIGWLLVKKHKDVMIKGKTVDMSDLEADPVVRFQRKFYLILAPMACFVLPTLIPWYCWNENIYVAYYVNIIRYTFALNGTWLVNSAAHIWGSKPYDINIAPTENKFVAAVTSGEGWHNYHHVFPWDYKAAELGNYRLNMSTGFIDLMAKIGWAYDLKTVSTDMINKRIARTGDGTRRIDNSHHHIFSDKDTIWGWGDKDMKHEDIEDAQIYNKID